MRRRKSLALIAAGAFVADLAWLSVTLFWPPRPLPDVPHYLLQANAASVELALACGATSGMVEAARTGVPAALLLEFDAQGKKVADCILHRSGGAITPTLSAGSVERSAGACLVLRKHFSDKLRGQSGRSSGQ